METLEPPIIRYLEGARPSHSGTVRLHENFAGIDSTVLRVILTGQGYLEENGKVARKSLEDGFVDRCENKLIWNLDKVQELLTAAGIKAQRKAVNQELNLAPSAEPKWVNQGTIASYFNVSAAKIGKWLTEAGMKKGDAMTEVAFDSGLGTTTTMNAGGKKTRTILMWDLHRTIEFLMSQGHELDRRSMDALKGKGKNSDVVVDSMEGRAQEFVREFTSTFRNKDNQRDCLRLVAKTPRGVLMRAEKLMNKPGFFTKDLYRKYIK